ncbi:MAG TPA: tetratricopeptide repeat protein [Bdellovibrionota bacterium]|nr:tetratricopeptide repeat protein [Bdellovibrionota bacterium]
MRSFPESLAWIWAGLLLLAVLAHGGAVRGEFHFDDSHTIELNPAVKSVSRIPHIWRDVSTSSAIPENRIYRPLTFTAFNLLWASGDGSPVPFFLFKLLLHASVAFLLGLIWLELFARAAPQYAKSHRERAAWAIAALFAAHPACSEIVNYVSSTTSLLAAFFYSIAFLLFIRGKTLISIVAYAASALSKEEGITLPAVLVLHQLVFASEGLRPGEAIARALRRAAPWIVAGIALAALVVGMMPHTLKESRGTLSPMLYFFTQWRAYLHYFGLSFVPAPLNADHVSFGFAQGFLEVPVVLSLAGNLALLGLAWACRRRARAFTFGLLWFYVALAPASSVVPLAEPVNEHRMYLGYVGWFGAVGGLVLFIAEEALRLKPAWKWIRASLAAVLAVFCVLSQARAYVWNDRERLWTDTLRKNPTNGRALNNLALIRIRQARFPEALVLLGRCEEVWPVYVYCAINKGIALAELGRLDDAERSYRRAIDLRFARAYSSFYYAKFLEEKRGNAKEAARLYRHTLDVSGGTFDEARVRLERLRRSDPSL